jgi:hypothetical protein
MTDQQRDKSIPLPEDEVVLLKDLAPRGDVSGGASKLRFGEPTSRKGRGGHGG